MILNYTYPQTLVCTYHNVLLTRVEQVVGGKKLFVTGQEMIIAVGCPASGKSSFFANNFVARDYTIVNRV